MPKPYNRDEALRTFESFTLGYVRDTSRGPAEFPGHFATFDMTYIVEAWLLGRSEDLLEALVTRRSWFEQANAIGEQFGQDPEFDAALRNEAYGLCLWMLGEPGAEPYRQAIRHWERHFASEGKKTKPGPPRFDYDAQRYEDPYIHGLPIEPGAILHGSLADYLASCAQCGEFARGVALYEKVGGNTDLADSRIQTPIHLGYWLCKHGAASGVDASACALIGARVLRANLRTRWLGAGQMVRAAGWLKTIAAFAGWNVSAREVLLRAHEFIDRK
jgi:hypothetical protein